MSMYPQDFERLMYPLLNEMRCISDAIHRLSDDLKEVRRMREFLSVTHPGALEDFYRYDMVSTRMREVK